MGAHKQESRTMQNIRILVQDQVEKMPDTSVRQAFQARAEGILNQLHGFMDEVASAAAMLDAAWGAAWSQGKQREREVREAVTTAALECAGGDIARAAYLAAVALGSATAEEINRLGFKAIMERATKDVDWVIAHIVRTIGLETLEPKSHHEAVIRRLSHHEDFGTLFPGRAPVEGVDSATHIKVAKCLETACAALGGSAGLVERQAKIASAVMSAGLTLGASDCKVSA